METPLPFETAYIQESGNGRLMHEATLVLEHCKQIGLRTKLYVPKRIARRQLPLSHSVFVFGDHDCMKGAMQQLGIPVPDVNSYPSAFSHFLKRKVKLDTLASLAKQLREGGRPVFAKPAGRAKVFTGKVFVDHSDYDAISGVSAREPIWLSEVVSWRSEYRVYVTRGEIVAIDHYEGDPAATINLSEIEMATRAWEQTGEAPAGYGIDFGVLAGGETALVEANDGFALGAYQIACAPYAELLFARWQQLLLRVKKV